MFVIWIANTSEKRHNQDNSQIFLDTSIKQNKAIDKPKLQVWEKKKKKKKKKKKPSVSIRVVQQFFHIGNNTSNPEKRQSIFQVTDNSNYINL